MTFSLGVLMGRWSDFKLWASFFSGLLFALMLLWYWLTENPGLLMLSIVLYAGSAELYVSYRLDEIEELLR